MSLSKKIDLSRDFAADVSLSEAPPLLGFCLGWQGKFVGYESGQIQSVKLLQNMVSSTTQHPPHPPGHGHTVSVYTVLFTWEGGKGGGIGESARRLEGQ